MHYIWKYIISMIILSFICYILITMLSNYPGSILLLFGVSPALALCLLLDGICIGTIIEYINDKGDEQNCLL